MAQNPILFVAVAEFDIDKGNTFSVMYPKDFDLTQTGLTMNVIADMCLPDGAHLHESDATYLILDYDDKKRPAEKEASVDAEGDQGAKNKVFGVAVFKNKADPSVRRGAIQKSLLAVCKAPIYDILEPLLKEGVGKFIDTGKGLVGGDDNILKEIFDGVNGAYGVKDKISLWGKEWSMVGEPPKEDVYPGASLTRLVKRFGADVMYLWYALLLEQRVLFSGQPASEVGQCCLTVPLLVAPLRGFAGLTQPYVALTDMTKLRLKAFICGATNALFETKPDWFDVLGSFSTGIVKPPKLRLSSADRQFIHNVLNGLSGKNEAWLRTQFRNYTRAFLDGMKNESLRDHEHRALAESVRVSSLYARYRAQLKGQDDAKPTSNKALEAWEALKDESLGDNDRLKKVFEVLNNLADIHTIEQLVSQGAVKLFAKLLVSQSAQIRKYAVLILAQLAISTKGQVQILEENLLAKVGAMLSEMANVASAACYCLYKVSSLYIGVCALLKEGLHKKLVELICSASIDLNMKKTAALTLLQIYSLKHDAEIVGREEMHKAIKAAKKDDKDLVPVLYQLLDVQGDVITSIPVSAAAANMIAGLGADRGDSDVATGQDPRSAATSYVLSEITAAPEHTLVMCAVVGVKLLLDNANDSEPEDPLARLSYAVLTITCETAIGRASLLGNNAMERALKDLASSTDLLHTFYVLRFIEVCCEHEKLAEQVVKKRGLDILWEKFEALYDKPSINTVCLPALGAVRNLVLLHRALGGSQAAEIFEPIKLLWKHIDNVAAVTRNEPLAKLVASVVALMYPDFVEQVSKERADEKAKKESKKESTKTGSFLDELLGHQVPRQGDTTSRGKFSHLSGDGLRHSNVDDTEVEVKTQNFVQSRIFVIHLPDGKKSLVMKPMDSIEKVLGPICAQRNIAMDAYVATTPRGHRVALSTLQGNIQGAEINFNKTQEEYRNQATTTSEDSSDGKGDSEDLAELAKDMLSDLVIPPARSGGHGGHQRQASSANPSGRAPTVQVNEQAISETLSKIEFPVDDEDDDEIPDSLTASAIKSTAAVGGLTAAVSPLNKGSSSAMVVKKTINPNAPALQGLQGLAQYSAMGKSSNNLNKSQKTEPPKEESTLVKDKPTDDALQAPTVQIASALNASPGVMSAADKAKADKAERLRKMLGKAKGMSFDGSDADKDLMRDAGCVEREIESPESTETSDTSVDKPAGALSSGSLSTSEKHKSDKADKLRAMLNKAAPKAKGLDEIADANVIPETFNLVSLLDFMEQREDAIQKAISDVSKDAVMPLGELLDLLEKQSPDDLVEVPHEAEADVETVK